jgi:hypothetical protein
MGRSSRQPNWGRSGAAAFAFGWFGRSAKARGFVLFASGQEAEKVTVGQGAESFCTVTEVMQKAGCEGAGCVQAVFGFKPIERGQGNAVSAVEMAKQRDQLSVDGQDAGVWVEVARVAWCI